MAEIIDRLDQLFELKEQDIRTYSPLTLAYIGDSVYEVVVRTIVVRAGNCPVNKLHHRAVQLVKASAQAEIARRIRPVLTPEEESVFRRGRNTHSPTMAKHATVSDYRHATGFEALIGWLYLERKTDRMLELIRMGLEGTKSGLAPTADEAEKNSICGTVSEAAGAAGEVHVDEQGTD